MPSTSPPVPPEQAQSLKLLGDRLRAARKSQGVSATALAESAAMSRVTLHRIERGEASVTIGAWISAAAALGLKLDVIDPLASGTHAPALPTGDRIRLDEYPQLKQLAWQLQGVEEVTPQEALALYERNWRHVERQKLTMKEIALVNALATTLGGTKRV